MVVKIKVMRVMKATVYQKFLITMKILISLIMILMVRWTSLPGRNICI